MSPETLATLGEINVAEIGDWTVDKIRGTFSGLEGRGAEVVVDDGKIVVRGPDTLRGSVATEIALIHRSIATDGWEGHPDARFPSKHVPSPHDHSPTGGDSLNSYQC